MRLTWILAGLFFAFGLLMLGAGDGPWGRTWAGLCTLALGGFAISMARDGLATGQIRFNLSVIRRSHQPRTFRATVSLVGVTGAIVVIAGIWLLFFKPADEPHQVATLAEHVGYDAERSDARASPTTRA